MSFIIRRGGYGPKTYWAGFKGDDQVTPRSKRGMRLRWSKARTDAIKFVRRTDAEVVRCGLRMYRLDPSVVQISDDAE